MSTVPSLPHWLAPSAVEVAGHEPIFLNRPGSFWVILAGQVDLFMVRLHDGKELGARNHIVRIHEGRGFFGMDTSAVTADWTVVAQPGPGSQMLEASRDSLLWYAAQPEHAERVLALIDDWIGALSNAVAGELEPKQYLPVEPGSTLVIPRDAKPLIASSGVVWVKHLEGEGSFLGNANLPVNGAYSFPLSHSGWLLEQAQNRVTGTSTQNTLASDDPWAGLDVFHRVVFNALVISHQAAEEKERQRLLLKQKGEDTRLDMSLRQLAVPLRTRGSRSELLLQDVDHPLLAACQALGTVQGIVFRASPEITRGLTLKDPVASISRSSGIRYRRVVLDEGWNKREGPPLLVFRESDKRPIAMLPKRGRGYDAFDPVERGRLPVDTELIGSLEPFGYVFYRAFPPRAVTVKDLLLFGLHGSWRDAFLILAMGIVTGLLGMATPILTGTIFDTIIPGAQRQRMLEMAVFLGSASLASVMFSLTRSFAVLRIEGKMESTVQAAVWDRLLSLPVPFFRQFSAGDLAMRGLAVTTMRQILTGSAMSSIFSGIFSVFNFGLLFYYSPRMAVLATALTVVALIFTLVCSYLQLRNQRETTELGGKITGMVLQFIMGIAKFRVSGTENRAFISWAAAFGREKLLGLKARKVSNWLAVFNSVFGLGSTIAIFWTMAYMMSQPNAKPLTTGEFLAFNSAYGQFAGSMLQLTSVFITLLAIVPMYERAKPILTALPEVDPSKPMAGELSGSIEISHVNFRYKEDGPLVLKDISVSIKPGEFVAFVGPSGSGKSTIFRLLLGFETPESGTVYFDGQELSSLDIQSVRQQMGVVMQNSNVFSGDIYNNIVCSAPYSIDEAWEAAKLAGFEKDLQAMPMGMHTIIGDGGAGLSGGQRQRLMIARAIVGKPRLLLFDEATSALDNQTQAIVSRSLEQLKSTRVVIAHRLTTIINADRIFVIENGNLVQSGTYTELMRQEGPFADLAKRQLT